MIYRQPGGEEQIVEIADGMSVMQAAVANGITEIVAEFGGTLGCATCDVYIDEDDFDRLDPLSEEEDEMLDFTASARQPNSRLSCQLLLSPELDGLVVRLPPTQS